jgi:hypothetical protein
MIGQKRSQNIFPNKKDELSRPYAHLDTPTAEKIQVMLAGLNRISMSYGPGPDFQRCTAIGISNYVRWFERHGIAIHELPNTHVWQLGPEPVGPRPKTSKMHGGC